MVWPDATVFVYALIIKVEGTCDNSHGIPDDMGMMDVCYGFYWPFKAYWLRDAPPV